MAQVKPLKDWTLGEVMKECSNHEECEDGTCPFFKEPEVPNGICCRFGEFPPVFWELTEQSRFTPEEVERLKALKQFAPGVQELILQIETIWGLKDGKTIIKMEKNMFPSIRHSEIVKISDIIGGEK